jgi:putative transposase
MTRGRPKTPLVLSAEEREQLRSWSRSRSLPKGLVDRVQIVLLSADGETNKAIAARLGLSQPTVGKWRRRYLERGLQGLHDELRPGRPRSIEDERIAGLITDTLKKQPKGATHWSCRTMAAEAGVSKSTVQRIWQAVRLQPHRYDYFKLSTDPFFVEKVRDIVGLYLNPPDHAIVLCVDEKSQCQALERSQPILPMGLGYLEGYTHDYRRHGTTNLFAALDIANGQVLAQCKPRHRHEEFLQFLRHIDANVPADLDVHLIADNYATHKHPKVRLWFAQRPRYHMHFTPTYASWLNQVEIWFSLISRKAIHRGSFNSTKALLQKIQEYVRDHNASAKPFVWTATADSIFEKLSRLCETISGTDY